MESNNVTCPLILGKWKLELSIHRPQAWDFCQLWQNSCCLSSDTTKVSPFVTYLWLIINTFLEVQLYQFSQNDKATFLNKDLIYEKTKPWQQWMVCFPLSYRNTASCPSHEKNLWQPSLHRLHTYRNHGLSTPAAPAPAACLTPGDTCRSAAALTPEGLHVTPIKGGWLSFLKAFFKSFAKSWLPQRQEGISAVWRQLVSGPTLDRSSPHLAW